MGCSAAMCSRDDIIGLGAAVMCSRFGEQSDASRPKRVFDTVICSRNGDCQRNLVVPGTAICSRFSRLDDSLAAICSRLSACDAPFDTAICSRMTWSACHFNLGLMRLRWMGLWSSK